MGRPKGRLNNSTIEKNKVLVGCQYIKNTPRVIHWLEKEYNYTNITNTNFERTLSEVLKEFWGRRDELTQLIQSLGYVPPIGKTAENSTKTEIVSFFSNLCKEYLSSRDVGNYENDYIIDWDKEKLNINRNIVNSLLSSIKEELTLQKDESALRERQIAVKEKQILLVEKLLSPNNHTNQAFDHILEIPSIKEITNLGVKTSGIYFLVNTNNRTVQYVGKSGVDVCRRALSHKNDPWGDDFDKAYYLELDERVIGNTEKYYIDLINPKYNKQIPR